MSGAKNRGGPGRGYHGRVGGEADLSRPGEKVVGGPVNGKLSRGGNRKKKRHGVGGLELLTTIERVAQGNQNKRRGGGKSETRQGR